MNVLQLRPVLPSTPAVVALGEVMIRLDPGEERIHTTRVFRVWEGGGEYNMVRGLRRVLAGIRPWSRRSSTALSGGSWKTFSSVAGSTFATCAGCRSTASVAEPGSG
jgi:hypothetical protein